MRPVGNDGAARARPWGRAARTLALLTACGGAVGASTWYGCAVYDPSLLLAATDDAGDSASAGDAGGAGDASDAGGGGGEAASPCAETFPPLLPSADDPSDAGDQTFLTALHTLDLGLQIDGGAPPLYGYDLDHVYTCCMGAPASCTPPIVGSQHCDEDGGRDNAGGQLLANFALLAPTVFNADAISQRLQKGTYSILIQIQHYNGQLNDTQVTAALYASSGIDAGGDAAAPLATWNGTDVWTVDDSFVLNGDASPTLPTHFDVHAYVTGGVLVMQVNFPLSLGSSSTSNLTLDLTGGVLAARIVPVGDGTYRLQDGQLAGRWSASSILAALPSLTFLGQPVCPGSSTYTGIKQQICQAADITADPGSDNKGTTCDALSVALGFTADPALMGSVVTAGSFPSLCGDGAPPPPDDCTKP
jgi:hypothetical protein